MVERPAQDRHAFGEFPGVLAEGDHTDDQPADPVLGAVDLRLAPLQAPGLLGVAGLPRQLDQMFEGPGLEGLEFDQPGRFPPLDLGVAAAVGHPGADRGDLLGPGGARREPARGLPDPGGVRRRHRQVEAGPPDRGIVRASVPAPLQPRLGLAEPAGHDRVPGPSQPDPIIPGIGLVEEGLPGVDGHRVGVILPEVLEQFAGIRATDPGGRQRLAHFGVSAFQPQQSGEGPQQGVAISRPGRVECLEEARLGRGVSAQVHQHGGAATRRRRDNGCPEPGPAPTRPGRARASPAPPRNGRAGTGLPPGRASAGRGPSSPCGPLPNAPRPSYAAPAPRRPAGAEPASRRPPSSPPGPAPTQRPPNRTRASADVEGIASSWTGPGDLDSRPLPIRLRRAGLRQVPIGGTRWHRDHRGTWVQLFPYKPDVLTGARDDRRSGGMGRWGGRVRAANAPAAYGRGTDRTGRGTDRTGRGTEPPPTRISGPVRCRRRLCPPTRSDPDRTGSAARSQRRTGLHIRR